MVSLFCQLALSHWKLTDYGLINVCAYNVDPALGRTQDWARLPFFALPVTDVQNGTKPFKLRYECRHSLFLSCIGHKRLPKNVYSFRKSQQINAGPGKTHNTQSHGSSLASTNI